MRILFSLKFFGFGLMVLILVSIISAFAAGISVPDTNVGTESIPVYANDIKPPACTSLNLTNTISGSGTITGTTGNDLIIGSTGADTIDGLGGDDCILGGNGDNTITGGDGNDVCIGGAGTDTFTTCESEIQ
jgi:Ca2+-binding RTX toxin-like protein